MMTPTTLEDFLRQWRVEQDVRMGRIEASIRKISENRPNKEFYTCAEFAKLVNRAEYTVREWARLGRLRAEKTHGGRGRKPEWRFTQAEFNRYEAEGLLPESHADARAENSDVCSQVHG